MSYIVQPLDLMQYINTKYHEPFIHELIEFEGNLDLIRFKSALNKLVEAFPLLKCHYDSGNNIFIENKDFIIENLLTLDNESKREDLLTMSLDASEKLVQFTLSKNALFITISHLLCDGSGFKKLIYLLCDFYNGKNRDDLCHLMNRDFSHLTKKLTGTSMMTIKMLCSMISSYKNKKVYESVSNPSINLVERAINLEVMKKVHALAKAQGATLNDVFLTAYARAISRLYDRQKINIPCTVDLRKYAKECIGIANLTGTYNLNVKIDIRKSFSASLLLVTKKMLKQKRTKNDIAGPFLLVSKYEKMTLDKFLKLYGGMNTSPFTDYTNLGLIDDNQVNFDGITIKRVVGYSGLNKAPYFSIAISSFKGETTISSMCYCGASEKKKIELLLDGIIKEISSFCNE